MEVYPKQIVFCPKAKREQDGNNCLTCELYKSHIKEDNKQLFIACLFEKETITMDLCQ